MTSTVTFDDVGTDDRAFVGGKGANLGELLGAGLPVPSGFVVTTEAYEAFVTANDLGDGIVAAATRPDADDPASFETAATEIRDRFVGGTIPEGLETELREAIEALAGDGRPMVARSSATAEDLPGASFAGQQATVLDLQDADAVLEAVVECWASLFTARAMAYRRREGIAPEDVRLAVVVQELVPADAAGIAFTADPSSGRRDHVVVNAAWGLGEAVVGGEVTPDTLTIEKESGRVLDREMSEKAVMTVRTGSGTETRPVPAEKRREPVLSDAQAARLAELCREIEAHYGAPQDIEWTLLDDEFAIVQARPITALPDPIGTIPTEWDVPDAGIYVRGSIIEQLPDPLSPLFADLAADPIPRTLRDLLVDLLGGELGPEDVSFETINGYAYIRMRLGPFGRVLVSHVAETCVFMFDVLANGAGVELLDERFRPDYVATVERWEAESIADLPSGDLLAGAEELLTEGVRYYTGVQTVMPPAMFSEVSFTWLYERLVRRDGDPPAQPYLLGFDSVPLRAEQSLYDVSAWSRDRPALREALLDTDPAEAAELLDSETPPGEVSEEVWAEWRERFGGHLDDYGHLLYGLDFVNPVPADDPEPVFRTLTQYLRGEGRDPHERQRAAVERRERLADETASRLAWPLSWVFRRLLGWAQTYVPEREDALADLGLGWPRLRELLGELGARFVAAGVIDAPEDVYWLERGEIERTIETIEADEAPEDLAETVTARRTEWRGRKRATPPQLLPADTWLTAAEGILPAEAGAETGDLDGVAASAGRVTATARVVEGPDDFDALEPGDILVARITTPAWTPLFAHAAGIVTDVGGPLSHGSIVAREYEIPAVLGTGNATSRIEDGAEITVDGDAGTVSLAGADGERDDASSATPATGSTADGAARRGVRSAVCCWRSGSGSDSSRGGDAGVPHRSDSDPDIASVALPGPSRTASSHTRIASSPPPERVGPPTSLANRVLLSLITNTRVESVAIW